MAKLIPVNGSDRSWTRNRFVLWFGQCAPTYLMIWANDIESAFEIAVEWLDDNAPGHLTSFTLEDYQLTAKELKLEWRATWPDYDDMNFVNVVDTTEADHTTIGHTTLKHGTHVASYEWGIIFENPTRAQIKALIGE